MMITKADGNECDKNSRGLKLRLMDVYKRPGTGSAEFMAELRQLTTQDNDDFCRWFNEAGYVTPSPGSN